MRGKRIEEIDIVKGIGIILVVAGHACQPFPKWILLFHVALFYIASGFLYKKESTSTFGSTLNFVKKRIISLYLPYVVWNIIFLLLVNFFLRINFYTSDPELFVLAPGFDTVLTQPMSAKGLLSAVIKVILLSASSQIPGPSWFMSTLFLVSVAYAAADFVIRKLFKKDSVGLIIQAVISILLLAAGTLAFRTGHYHAYYRALTGYSLFFMGVIIRRFNPLEKIRKVWIHVLAGAASLGLLILLSGYGMVSLASNNFTDPLYLLIVSVLGWVLTYEAAKAIKYIPYIKQTITLCGKHSREIMIFHLLAFRFVNLFRVNVFNLPKILTASSPVFDPSHGWWIAYVVIGVSVPLVITVFVGKVLARVRESFRKPDNR